MHLHDDIEYGGKHISIDYHDADSFVDLPREQVRQHYGVCFYRGQVVLAHHPRKESAWALPGGKPEPGESLDETLLREVQEETNMRVLSHRPIGYQVVTDETGDAKYQLRSFCLVEPFGPFVGDPAGDVGRIELVAPSEVNGRLAWAAIGDRIMERATEMANEKAAG